MCVSFEAPWHAVQGSAHLFSNLQTDIGKHMQKFEQAALRTSLRVPAGLVHPSALPPALEALHSPEDEEKADAQLAQLRRKIGEVGCPLHHMCSLCPERSLTIIRETQRRTLSLG